jgi:hypothetical protein
MILIQEFSKIIEKKKNDLVATSRAERGIARHFLIDRLEASPTNLHHAPILIG